MLYPPGDVRTLECTTRLALSDLRAPRWKGLESRRIATEEVSVDAVTDVFVRALHQATGWCAAGQGTSNR